MLLRERPFLMARVGIRAANVFGDVCIATCADHWKGGVKTEIDERRL